MFAQVQGSDEVFDNYFGEIISVIALEVIERHAL